MNQCRILVMNLLNRRQRFESDARCLTLKDTDQLLQKNWFIKLHLIPNSEEMKHSIQNSKPNDVYLPIYSTL